MLKIHQYQSYKPLQPFKTQKKSDKTAQSQVKANQNLKTPNAKLLAVSFAGITNSLKNPDGTFKHKFRDNHFIEHKDFSNGKFNAHTIDFWGTKFHETSDFSNTKIFAEETFFENAVFYGKTKFKNTLFDSNFTSLTNTIFNKSVSLYNSSYKGYSLNFDQAEFNGFASFKKANFDVDHITFKDSYFHKRTSFEDAHFKGENLKFEDVHFNDITFRNAIFDSKNIMFDNVSSYHDVDFSDATFNTAPKFRLKKRVDRDFIFEGAMFNQGADLSKQPVNSIKGMFKGAKYKPGTEKLFKLPKLIEFEDLGFEKCKTKTQSKHDKMDELLDKLISTTDPNEKIEIEEQLAGL